MRQRFRLYFGFGLIGLHLCCWLFLGAGRDPDSSFEAIYHVATAMVFGVWCLSIMGWGLFLSGIIGVRECGLPFALAIGTAGYALSAAAFGLLGWIGPSFRPLFVGLMYVGILLLPVSWQSDPVSPSKKSPAFYALLGLLLVIVVLRAVAAQVPWAQSDPLFYQLLAPRLWFDHGKISLPGGAPLTFLASYWEYLHLWAISLLSSESGRGLIEVQLFAQLTHVVLGYAACGWAIYHLCRRNFLLQPFESLVSVFAALSVRDLEWVSYLAKNDWGVSFWLLSGMGALPAFAAVRPESRAKAYRLYAISGLLVGIAVGAKFTQFIFAATSIGASFWMVASHRNLRNETAGAKTEYLRGALVFLGMLLLGLLPFLMRNWIEAGNPLFPYFSRLFNTEAGLNPGLLAELGHYEGSGFGLASIRALPRGFWNVLTSDFVFFPMFLCPLLVVLGKKNRPRWSSSLVAALFALTLFILAGTKTEVRHFGCILIVFGMLGPLILANVLRAAHATPKLTRFVMGLFLVGVLFLSSDLFINGNYDAPSLVRSARDVTDGAPAYLRIRTDHEGGLAKAWLRLNAKPGAPVVATGDLQFYYLPLLNVSSFEQATEFAQLVQSQIRPEEVLLKLNTDFGYQYLLDVKHSRVQSAFSLALNPFIAGHSCILTFQSPDSRIVDLGAVRALAGRPCPKK